MKKINWLLVAVFVFASMGHAQERMLMIDDIFKMMTDFILKNL